MANFLAYVASGSVGGVALATTCVKAGATAGAGPGGFPQCLYMNGVSRGPSYLCSLLICSFLGTTCADGLVQREVFLLKEVLNVVAIQEAFNYLVSKCSFKCKEPSISCKSGQLPEADKEVVKRLARLLYAAAEHASFLPSTVGWLWLFLLRYYSLSPRFSTIVTVSWEKHKVSACTSLACTSLAAACL